MPQILTLSLLNRMKKFLLRYLAFFHSVQLRFSTQIRPSTWVCLMPCGNREKFFPNTGYDKSPRLCNMAVSEPAKTTQACNMPVLGNRGLTCIQCRLHVVKRSPSVLQRKGRENSSSSGPTVEGHCIDWAAVEQVQLADAIWALLTTDPWELFFGIIEQHISNSRWNYAQCLATYNPSRSKASVLPLSLRYLHAILTHMITGMRESTGIINTHDAYFLWCMLHGHVIDLAYFIALAIQHQTEWHRKGVICIGPYMSSQGISSMLSMRMIEKRRGTYPPQYRLAHSTEEEAPEDITDDVPPHHEDPMS
ncbi:hypothetical protein GOBAR_AA10596 [Gossypium barbadense]|uniref:Uncharacterized protein n=1 Tax=Gossypium barbadense TaxID=3634 RepID=A0A2P5Y3A4_GOSBA|nr:hypothetical protein GOBAR_AA10596 [Gossypium barbadense]